MERKVTKLEHSHVEVVVSVDEKSWKDAQKKAFDKLAKNVEVKGFRKGKAPENLVKARIDQVKVMDEAINALLPVVYKDILDNEKIVPMTQPKVDVTKLSDTELEVKFTIVTAPTAELGKYKDIKIGKEEAKIEDKDVENAINDELKRNATLVVKDGAAAMGDVVVMDFVGTIDGVAFEGGSAENHELELGSGQFIPGFEDQLVGVKADDKVDVKVKFPENYTAELKGKDAVFACTIHEVKEKKLPALDDEFVKELNIPDVTTVDAYKERKTTELKNNKERELRNQYFTKLLDAIAKDSKVDIPDEIVNEQVESRKKELIDRMTQSGLTYEQYLQIIGQTEEQFVAKLKEDSTRDITNFVLIDEIGKTEKIEVKPEDVDFEMAKIADQYKMSVEDVKKALANQMPQYIHNIREQRIEAFLYENNK